MFDLGTTRSKIPPRKPNVKLFRLLGSSSLNVPPAAKFLTESSRRVLQLNYNSFVTLLNVSGEHRSSRPRADLTGEGLRNSPRILDT